jgi:hypothetical protein
MKKMLWLFIFISFITHVSFPLESDYRFDVSADVLPFVFFTALDMAWEMYINPHMSFSNFILFYHNSVPSLMKLFLSLNSEDLEACCLLIPDFSFTNYHPEGMDFSRYSKDCVLSYFVTFHYYVDYYDGFFIGGGIGTILNYDDFDLEFQHSIYITVQAGMKTIILLSGYDYSLTPKVQVDISLSRFPDISGLYGLFTDSFFLVSFHIGRIF